MTYLDSTPPLQMRKALVVFVCSVALLASAAPAIAATDLTTASAPDPFERFNRAAFAIHQFFDRLVLRPAAIGYKRILPRPIRAGLRNAASNLGEPSVAVNDALQGHGKKAAKTVARFIGDTTIGVFGLFDIATGAGLPHHPNDFGVTLARYGVKSGPYLFIPLAGPTTVRDGVGTLVGFVLDPLVYARYPYDYDVAVVTTVAGGLDTRAEADGQLKALAASSTDEYAALRSYFLQNRQSKISGGALSIQTLPDFDDPGGAAKPAPTPADPAQPQAAQPQAAQPQAAQPQTAPAEAAPAEMAPLPTAAASPQPVSPLL